MRLAIISSPEVVKDEHKILNMLFEHGLEFFHLRKPMLSLEGHRDYLSDVKPSYIKRIIVHNHFGLLSKYNLKGVHLNTSFYKNADALMLKEIRQKRFQVGTSVHSFEEVEKLKYVDYYFISPVFESISKERYKGQIGIQEYSDFLHERKSSGFNKLLSIALGGIDESNIHQTKKAGFDGAALLGAIWSKGMEPDEIIAKFDRIKNILIQ